jgi:hypothetical protein
MAIWRRLTDGLFKPACLFACLLAGTVSASELQLLGKPVPGALLIGKVSGSGRLSWDGQPVDILPDGHFALGIGRDEKGRKTLVWTTADGRQTRWHLTIRPRKFAVQRVNGLPPQTVSPKGEALLRRIREEAALVRKARANLRPETWFAKPFMLPAKGPISGVYGSQRILNGQPRRPHFGQDIAAPAGAPVHAAATGVVTLAEPDLFYSGGTVIIDHGGGVTTSYLHLSHLDVKAGQLVRQGQLIGRVGSTGRASGPHLDWRLNWKQVRLDPALVVDAGYFSSIHLERDHDVRQKTP